MRVILVPSYTDIFDKDKDGETYFELTKDIPSKAIIMLMSYINNQLFYFKNDENIQTKILQFITGRFNSHDSNRIIFNINKFRQRTQSDIVLFGPRYNMEVISRELTNFRDLEFTDTTPEQELKIFKAYLKVVEDITDDDVQIFSKKYEDEDLHGIKTLVWPYAVKTFEFVYPHQVFPIIEGIKSLAFLEFCQRDKILNPHIQDFLSKNNCGTIHDYAGKVLGLCKLSLQDKPTDKLNNNNLFRADKPDSILDSFTLTSDDINNYKHTQKDYIGLKQKPIFKYDDKYVVTHWNYLYNKLFSGLLFSFHRSSSLGDTKKFEDYKSYIGTEFSHNILFKEIIKSCFPKADCLWFDEATGKDNIFNPDCYYRSGKKIFLIEFKDTLINKDIIHSEDFETIKKEIDKKFIKSEKKKKGISQIVRNLDYLTKNNPSFDPVFNKHSKQKVRNYSIYPIIIHTNFYFAIPGLNEYINENFLSVTTHLKNAFKPLKPLTIISMDFFIDKLEHFAQRAIKLEELVDEYFLFTKKRLKNLPIGTSAIENVLNSMASFDEFSLKKEETLPTIDNSNYLKSLYDCLTINLDKTGNP